MRKTLFDYPTEKQLSYIGDIERRLNKCEFIINRSKKPRIMNKGGR